MTTDPISLIDRQLPDRAAAVVARQGCPLHQLHQLHQLHHDMLALDPRYRA
ncbi:hypothetical protein [Streptomyces sp. NBC_00443]|uniref:hypothetical protein n=1 Tax=Streptomyces sp. NBC_00443 TaxID=2975743 RepID=UPI002E1BE03C